MTTRPMYTYEPLCTKEHEASFTAKPSSTPSPPCKAADPLCPTGYVSVVYTYSIPAVLTNSLYTQAVTPFPQPHVTPSSPPQIQRTFSPKKIYRKQQVLVYEPSVQKFVYAIAVDFEAGGDEIVVSGGFYQGQKRAVFWEYVDPCDDFCVSENELPNTTKHSMREITTKQARDEIARFRRPGRENTEFFAYLDQELAQSSAVHYGQLKAPEDWSHCRHIIGEQGSHFAELTHKYDLLFVWHDRSTGLFKVWGRDRASVMTTLRQLLFHKLKCKAEDDDARLRALIRAAETRYLNSDSFSRRHMMPVSSDI